MNAALALHATELFSGTIHWDVTPTTLSTTLAENWGSAKIFPYDYSSVLLIQFSGNSIEFKVWDLKSTTFTSSASYSLPSTSSILNATFDYSVIKSKKIATAAVYRKESPSNNEFTTLVRMTLEQTGSTLSISKATTKNTQSFSANENPIPTVSLVKQVGKWIFYCNSEPQNCFSYFSHDLSDPSEIASGTLNARLEGVDNALDLAFHENQASGEVSPFLLRAFTFGGGTKKIFIDLIRLSTFDAMMVTPANQCFTSLFVTTLSAKRCVLDCHEWQKQDGTFNCIDCTGSDKYLNNACVSTCTTSVTFSTASTSNRKICTDSKPRIDSRPDMTTANRFKFYNKLPQCSPEQVLLNTSCFSCGGIPLHKKEFSICELGCNSGLTNLGTGSCLNLCGKGPQIVNPLDNNYCVLCDDNVPILSLLTGRCMSTCSNFLSGGLCMCYAGEKLVYNGQLDKTCAASCPVNRASGTVNSVDVCVERHAREPLIARQEYVFLVLFQRIYMQVHV
jgi:hypothetical protein